VAVATDRVLVDVLVMISRYKRVPQELEDARDKLMMIKIDLQALLKGE
jgi:hypothetical protein